MISEKNLCMLNVYYYRYLSVNQFFFNRPYNEDNPYLSPEKQNCALKAFAPNDQTLALNIN